ncbi:MAG: hypothetical protein WD768_01250 [Phycisphaeraceae bacterium]
MSTNNQYVKTDEHGVYRVGKLGVMLDGIAYAFYEGDSAETIWQQYPSATLEEVYGAIAFILANRAEIENYLKRQEQEWERFKAECDKNPSPVVERLRRLRLQPASNNP